MGKNVEGHFSRNFDIFSKKITHLNALLSLLLSSRFSAPSASSETQGLLAGTMRYFRASDIFGRKFTLSAGEPLGTYSYQTSSRSGRIPFR